MGDLMFLIPQGQNPNQKIAILEKRVEYLEKTLLGLQSEQKPRIGRPPKKVQNEPNQPEISNTSSD